MEFFKKYQHNNTDYLIEGAVYNNSDYYLIGFNGDEQESIILKLDDLGEVVYSESLKIDNSYTRVTDIELADDGNLIITGGYGFVNHSAFFAKISAESGAIIWIKSIPNQSAILPYTKKGLSKLLNDKYILLTQEFGSNRVNLFDGSGTLIKSLKFIDDNANPNPGLESLESRGVSVNGSKSLLVFTFIDRTQSENNKKYINIVTNDALEIVNSISFNQISVDNFFPYGSCVFINENEVVFQGIIDDTPNNNTGDTDEVFLFKWDVLTNPSSFQGVKTASKQLSNTFLYNNGNICLSVVSSATSDSNKVAVFDTDLNLIGVNALSESLDVNAPIDVSKLVLLSFKDNSLIIYVNGMNAVLVTDQSLTSCVTIPSSIVLENHFASASTAVVSTADLNFTATTPLYNLSEFELETINVCQPTVNVNNSLISANPLAIDANNSDQSVITVQLKDNNNDNITTGGNDVEIFTLENTNAELDSNGTQDNGDGTYEILLNASNEEEVVRLRFSVDGVTSLNYVDVTINQVVSNDNCRLISTFRNNTNSSSYSNIKYTSQGFIAIGRENVSGLLTSFDSIGQIIWNKSYTYSDVTLSLVDLEKLDSEDGFIIFGSYNTGETNRAHLVVFRIDMSGNLVWSKLLYSANTRFGRKLKRLEGTTSIDAFVISSWYNEFGTVDNIELYKIDANGNLLGAKNIYFPGGDEQVYGMDTYDSGFVISGSATQGVVMKFDNDLNFLWGKQFGGFHYVANIVYTGTVNNTDNFLLYGYYDNQNVIYVSYFNRLENSFNVKEFDVSAYNISSSLNSGVKLTRDESSRDIFMILTFGQSQSSSLVIKLDENLNEIWKKRLSITDISVITELVTNGSNILLSGYVIENAITTSLIAKTDYDLNSCITEDLPLTVTTSATFNASDSTPEIAVLTTTHEDISISVSDVSLERTNICSENCNPKIILSDVTSLQSPNFYIQASGSDGDDSAKGRHLRWMFRGVLGGAHLPKGNLAQNTAIPVNFNKPNDFVKIYKAPYVKKKTTLDFLVHTPEVVDSSNHLWIYRIEEKELYVHFINTYKYDEIVNITNPYNESTLFLKSYGDELLELECKEDLFFSARIKFSEVVVNSEYQVETLSVPENTLVANKVVSNRRTYNGPELNQLVRLLCENGRSIRCRTTDCEILSVDFEFYADTIEHVNQIYGWQVLGEFSLSNDDTAVLAQLEPNSGDVHGVWKRFNEDAYVNVENYTNKWNAIPEEGDRNIKQVVEQYIALSNDSSNPSGIEEVPLGNDPTDPNDVVQISNLDLLNVAAYDYHIARMLGLGTLDLEEYNTNLFVQANPEFLYVAEYTTYGDLEDGLGAREVHHLSMSLPTSNQDSRLPIPVQIDTITPGAFIGTDSDEPSAITGEDGYTHDGLARYVSLYAEASPEDHVNVSFFNTAEHIDLSTITYPIYAGLEYKLGNEDWQKPELSHDTRYVNAVPDGEIAHFETRFINIPNIQAPFYVHRQTVSGTHTYKSYGINWFSRSQLGEEASIETVLVPTNPLLPPSSTNALLIRNEYPLLLTSESEQERLNAIPESNDPDNPSDKTLIRLSFNYHSAQELKSYQVPLDSTISNEDLENTDTLFPNGQEIFANAIDVFFRNEVPNNVSGQIVGDIIDDAINDLLSIIETGPYNVSSNNTTINPVVTPGTEDNFVGGVFIQGSQRFIIHEVSQGANGPVFTVYKKMISESIVNGGMPSNTAEAVEMPVIEGDGFFMAIENMQTPASWGTPNPLGMQVQVEPTDEIHREVLTFTDSDGVETRQLQKTRGIWDTATVTPVLEPGYDDQGVQGEYHQGLYKFEFNTKTLEQHPQFSTDSNSVEWFRGSIRVFSNEAYNAGNPIKPRKVLSVLKIENILPLGTTTGENIVVYAHDPSFIQGNTSYDEIQTGVNVEVNFYPGYKVYLYADPAFNITEDAILPAEGEGMRNSIFGFRSKDSDGACEGPNTSCVSKISVPNVLFAQEIIEPLPPQEPLGGTFATRPDFFGRSTFTFTTQYDHKPHGVLFYRSNDEGLLNALYTKETMQSIRAALKLLGGNDEAWVTDRWKNFLDFGTLETNGDYNFYPPEEDAENRFKFPHPDKPAFFDWANQVRINLGLEPLDVGPDNTVPVGDERIFSFVKGAIYNAFVPLTEVPIIYQHIKAAPYQPQSKKQVIRDRNGGILSPTDPEFDMAPMMKTIDTSPHETLYTDFNLDGTSNNLYFYGAKELGTQLTMSVFSPFLGPIKLVNTNAPEQPEIKRIMPVLENQVLGITPKIQLEINAYPEVQNIQRITVYRTNNRLDARSVRTMEVAKVIDLTQEEYIGQSVLKVYDDFSDLAEIPYGEGLYYRITVSRAVSYTDKNNVLVDDFAPSQASKIVATMMVEASSPTSPDLSFEGNISIFTGGTPYTASNTFLTAVRFFWEKQAYNAKYHLFKMNNQGNWVKIYEIQTNDDQIEVALSETSVEPPLLLIQDENSVNGYHHFKVITENTSGMLSTEEKILTIPDYTVSDQDPTNPTGIGAMVVGSSFIAN